MIDIEDKKRVEEAVKLFERNTMGELVPVIAEASDRYFEVHFYCAVVLTFVINLTVLVLSFFWILPFEVSIFDYSLLVLFTMIAGFVVPFAIPDIKRLITPNSVLVSRVKSAANSSFLEEEVFNTADRIGIIIYVSKLERQVVLIADSGINDKVKQNSWNQIVDLLIKDIKAKCLVNGLVKAIDSCGELLLAHNFVNIDKNRNELRDHLRSKD